MHLSFVLHHLCDVDDFLALKICKEIAEALHDLLIAAFILKLWLCHTQFSPCAIQCLIFLLVLFYVDVFAQLVDQDSLGSFASCTIIYGWILLS